MAQNETFYSCEKGESNSILVPSLPDNETQRLEALQQYQILDTPSEEIFDEITALAAEIFSVPIVFITLIDSHRQWFKSKVGSTLVETNRNISFCAHTILQTDPFIVSDTHFDERFAANPLVISEPYIRFYGGVPLINIEKLALGALCIIDIIPRTLTAEQQIVLQILAKLVMRKLEQRRNQLLLTKEDTQAVSQLLVGENLRSKLSTDQTNIGQQIQPILSSSVVEFVAIAESIPLAVVLSRLADSLILYVNNHCCLIFGMRREEFIGRQAPEFYFNLKDRQALLDELKTYGYINNYEIQAKKADNTPFWVSTSVQSIIFNNEPAFLCTFIDITKRKQAELELRKVNRALKTLNECHQITISATSELELLQAICQITIKVGGYRLAWVGFAEQDAAKRVIPVAYAGYEQGYLESLNITWADTEQGRGPTGTAIRTGKPSIIKNILVDPNYIPWRQQAIERGYAASIALPLANEGEVFGALNIYAEEPDAFDSEEVNLLTKLADNLAYGIIVWRDRTIRQKAELALKQQTDQERLIATIAQRIRESLNLDNILNTTVAEVRQFLQAERVFIYRFEPDWSGTVIVESVESGCLSILGQIVKDSYFVETSGEQYKQGRIQAINDIYTSQLNECHIRFLEQFQVRANLVVPIIQGEILWGLLVANQCNNPRQWQELEINLLRQLATQVAIAIQQSELYQQLEAANLKLQNLANEDGLTQVANRRYFNEYLNKEWRRLAREQTSLSLILCDIDFFKTYNDTYGHLQGDRCLQQVASAISRAVKRPADLVARYGGEEFAIIMPNTNALGAVQVADFIRYEVQALKIAHAGSSVNKYVTLSLGIASAIPDHQLEPTALISAADKALYRAKALGRDRFFLQQSQLGY